MADLFFCSLSYVSLKKDITGTPFSPFSVCLEEECLAPTRF